MREKPGDEEWNRLDAMKIPLLCNLSQCKLIEGDFYAVIEHTNEVLKRDNRNVKALFRREKVNFSVWNLENARNDYKKCFAVNENKTK